MTRVSPLYTLKMTTGSPHLAKELQRVIYEKLKAIDTDTTMDAGFKQAAAKASVRIVMGAK